MVPEPEFSATSSRVTVYLDPHSRQWARSFKSKTGVLLVARCRPRFGQVRQHVLNLCGGTRSKCGPWLVHRQYSYPPVTVVTSPSHRSGRDLEMTEIVCSFLAVGAVAWATATAGRLAGISLTAIASGIMALMMPPVFSLRVESSAEIAVLVVNGVAGLIVAHAVRPRSSIFRVVESMQGPPERLAASDGLSLPRPFRESWSAIRSCGGGHRMFVCMWTRTCAPLWGLTHSTRFCSTSFESPYAIRTYIGSIFMPAGAPRRNVFGLRPSMLSSPHSHA